MFSPAVFGVLLGLGSKLIAGAFSFCLREFQMLSKRFDLELSPV